MSIVRLIISIIFPPIGLILNHILDDNNKIDKISSIISTILSIILLVFIIVLIIMVSLNNDKDNNIYKCEHSYYCEPSDSDVKTCYYCEKAPCNKPEKIKCNNKEDSMFNYETEGEKDSGEDEVLDE